MREEEELFREARRSREETAKLREGEEPAQDDDVPKSPLPEKDDPEPWAKTSGGDADSIADDD